MSIHTAYVKAIRAAQHFIYIENQYFLGSSFNWDSHRDLGESICDNEQMKDVNISIQVSNLKLQYSFLCSVFFLVYGTNNESIFFLLFAGANNLIPMEIALKIANKIRANERFAAYILIPMWPEGVTTSPQIQRILYWQVEPSLL